MIAVVSVSQWGNLIGYQLLWLIVVSSAGRGSPWLAAGASVVFVGTQLWLSRRRAADLRLLTLGVALGMLSDGCLARSGLLYYAAAVPAVPPGGAPLWIICLWAAFSLTLTRSLAWLARHTWIAALFGAVAGPLAYLGAARGWSAVRFTRPISWPAAWLALSWGIAMLLFTQLINHSAAAERRTNAIGPV